MVQNRVQNYKKILTFASLWRFFLRTPAKKCEFQQKRQVSSHGCNDTHFRGVRLPCTPPCLLPTAARCRVAQFYVPRFPSMWGHLGRNTRSAIRGTPSRPELIRSGRRVQPLRSPRQNQIRDPSDDESLICVEKRIRFSNVIRRLK